MFNIGSGVGHSVNQVLKIVAAGAQKKLDINDTEDRHFDVGKVILTTDKAKKKLHWKPEIALKDA